MLEKKFTNYLNGQVKGIKNKTIKTYPLNMDKMANRWHKEFEKKLKTTTPAERIIKRYESQIKDTMSNMKFLLSFKDCIKEDVIHVKEFLTGELTECATLKGKPCDCLYECDEDAHEGEKEHCKDRHCIGKTTSTDIGVYFPKLKDYRWFFVIDTPLYYKQEKEFDEKYADKLKRKPAYEYKDEFVDKVFLKCDSCGEECPKDTFHITIAEDYVTKEIVVREVKQFIKNYFKLNKKVVYDVDSKVKVKHVD